jgi:hypothetical protein
MGSSPRCFRQLDFTFLNASKLKNHAIMIDAKEANNLILYVMGDI